MFLKSDSKFLYHNFSFTSYFHVLKYEPKKAHFSKTYFLNLISQITRENYGPLATRNRGNASILNCLPFSAVCVLDFIFSTKLWRQYVTPKRLWSIRIRCIIFQNTAFFVSFHTVILCLFYVNLFFFSLF
jgi:hypothetical protein